MRLGGDRGSLESTVVQLEAEVARVPRWWHSIDLGNGLMTPGAKKPEDLEYEWWVLHVGDLRGQSVLDIGAWDGWFSFASERAGAERVVALDHFVWSIDVEKQWEYAARGSLPLEFEGMPGVWRPDSLPGKRGFDLARSALGSKVESVVADFMDMDLVALGRFDVVLYLGVLYHMRHPLLALERLRQVTDGAAYIETQAIAIPDRPDWKICEFFEVNELAGDPTNWWVPTLPTLISLCRAAGFSTVDPLAPAPIADGEVVRYAATVKAMP